MPILTTGAGNFPAIGGGGGGGYSGPGDVVSGATAWWGLRAYSNAVLGQSVCDVFGNTTTTTFTFVSKSDGSLELSAGGAAAFIAANSGVRGMIVNKLYDQTGNGHHMLTTGAVQPPTFTNSSTSLTSSYYVGDTAGSARLFSATGFAVAQPFDVHAVFKTTQSTGIQALLADSTNVGMTLSSLVGRLQASGGAVTGGSFTANAWHSYHGVFNGASSVISFDGNDTTVSPGTNAITSSHALTLLGNDFGENYAGMWSECGIWGSALSSGNRSSLNSNAGTFWGF